MRSDEAQESDWGWLGLLGLLGLGGLAGLRRHTRIRQLPAMGPGEPLERRVRIYESGSR